MVRENEYGRIQDKTTIKFFVLYVLQSLGGHAPKDAIDEVIAFTENASYFDCMEAMESLAQTGHIESFSNSKAQDLIFKLTPLGADTLAEFSTRVPSWTRRRIGNATLTYRARLKYDSEIRCQVDSMDDGSAMVSLSIYNDGVYMFSTALRMPTLEIANRVCEVFKKNPRPVYQAVVNAIAELVSEFES